MKQLAGCRKTFLRKAMQGKNRRKKKRSLCTIKERYEPVFNAAVATQMVFQRPVKTWLHD